MSRTHTAVIETGTRPGSRPASRVRLAVPLLVAIGPAAIAVLRYVLPYNTTDDPKQMATKVIAHQSRESLAIWLGFVVIFATVPAVIWVGHYARRYSRRIGTAAVAVLVPGFLALGLMMFSDLVMWTGADTGHPASDIGRMIDHMHPAAVVGEVVFVIGHILGTVLLGFALCRAPILRWIPLATIVCQPLHVFAGIVLASHGRRPRRVGPQRRSVLSPRGRDRPNEPAVLLRTTRSTTTRGLKPRPRALSRVRLSRLLVRGMQAELERLIDGAACLQV